METPQKTDPDLLKKENKMLFLLAFVFFAHVMDFVIMMPLGDILMKELSISAAQFSWLISAYSLLAFVMGLISATLTDKFDRRAALLFTLTGFTIGAYACGLVVNFEQLLIARGFTGAFGGVTGGIIYSIISDTIPFERRGRALGIITGSFSVSSIMGIPFSLWLAGKLGWQAPFLFFGVFSSIALMAAWIMVPSIRSHIDVNNRSKINLKIFKEVFGDINLVKGLLTTFLMTLGHFMIIPFIAPALIRNNGLTQEQIPLVYLLGGLVTLFSTPMIGRWTDRKGVQPVYLIMVLLSAVPILSITNVGPSPVMLMLLLTTLLMIFSSGRFVAANTLVTASVHSSKRGGFMSLRSSVIELAEGLAAMFGGYIVYVGATGRLENYHLLGYLSFGITLISLLILRTIKRVE
jgi:MFS transporter, DHA1 family, inner membrane transport protein